MSDIVIKVEDLGKQYRLGKVGTGTISHDINRWWHKVRGKEDPYLKIGEVNDRTKKGESDLVWAIQNINFDVKRGEVLGIIGRNGAGKSTLLKILSRVTGPTTGCFKVKGKIASLLEVGTGFHPDLSGKENIFLNGAVLGMTKKEISSKLDEIIDFSGIERYIDTPVKRYSSGMYVRLAFAVAAHLEPEILIVDEVLAVGDAEFQKKCMGKMKDITDIGRTVLFVSHNMTAVTTLCTRAIYLREGQVEASGDVKSIIDRYLTLENAVVTNKQFAESERPGNEHAKLIRATIINTEHQPLSQLYVNESFGIEIEFEVFANEMEANPNIHLHTIKNEYVLTSAFPEMQKFKKGIHRAIVWMPALLLNTGTYSLNVAFSSLNPTKVHFNAKECLVFELYEDMKNRNMDFNKSFPGIIHPHLKWEKK